MGLAVVLSLPHALEHLHLGENRDNSNGRSPPACNDLLSDKEERFFAALEQQAHALTTFAYRPSRPDLLTAFSGNHSFSSFEALESVSILGMIDAEVVSNLPFSDLARRAILSSTLRDIHFVGSSYRPPSDFHSPHMIAVMDRFMEMVRSRNIHITLSYEILREWYQKHPILSRRQEPPQHMIFDSANGGWMVNLDRIARIEAEEVQRLETIEDLEADDTEEQVSPDFEGLHW
ncbi:hypothetical protein BST61_g8364 [Cercospora zeina]